MWIFLIEEMCFFCEFLPRVFQERKGGQKRPKEAQKRSGRRPKEEQRKVKEGQNEGMISLFHI